MSLYHNPAISKNGLVLYLDAKSKSSYSGNGSIWIDRISNFNGTLGTPVFNPNGYFTFDGNDNVSFSNNYIGLSNLTENFSISIWFSPSTLAAYRGLFSQQTSTLSVQGTPRLDIGALSTTVYCVTYNDSSGDLNQGAFSEALTTGNWYNLVLCCGQDGKKVYLNNVLKYNNPFISTYTGTSHPAALGGGRWWYGDIAIFSVYNRSLSETEVDVNYKSIKYRFGL